MMPDLHSAVPPPGTPVKIRFGIYHHYAIVSDRIVDGKPTLISLSRRSGTVAEEAWDEVARGRPVRSSRLRSTLSPDLVVSRARSRIGERRYKLLTSNCEHFARECLGLPVRCRQLQGASGAGATALLMGLRLARVHPVVAVAATLAAIVLGSRLSAR